MQTKDKIIIAVLITIVATLYSVLLLTGVNKQATPEFGVNEVYNQPIFRNSSTTAYTVTTASLKLIATSTTPRRLAATFQPVNCTAGGTLFLNIESGDAAATAASGLAAYASTTLALGFTAEIPVVQQAVHGIVPSGTCTVLVTEYFAAY